MSKINSKEFKNLRFQNVTSSYGGRRYQPYAYTEQGILVLKRSLVGRNRSNAYDLRLSEIY